MYSYIFVRKNCQEKKNIVLEEHSRSIGASEHRSIGGCQTLRRNSIARREDAMKRLNGIYNTQRTYIYMYTYKCIRYGVPTKYKPNPTLVKKKTKEQKRITSHYNQTPMDDVVVNATDVGPVSNEHEWRDFRSGRTWDNQSDGYYFRAGRV